LVELESFITTRDIYDPRTVGEKSDSQERKLSYLQSIIAVHLQEVEASFAHIQNQVSQIFASSKKSEINVQNHVKERYQLALDIIHIQNFYIATIDKKCQKTNPFFFTENSGWVIYPSLPPDKSLLSQSLISLSKKRVSKQLQLLKTEIDAVHGNKKLSPNLQAEYEAVSKISQEESDAIKVVEETRIAVEKARLQWRRDLLEYQLQNALIKQQKISLKKSHDYLVKLYSLEPRADDELLELFSKSKYPETEKVKILMELKIPYKNFRSWESQNRKFRTVAQFVSFDKNTSKVTLEKPNGKKTVVRLNKLRYEDIKYIREQTTPQPTTTVQPKP
jgi:hypothetical protein